MKGRWFDTDDGWGLEVENPESIDPDLRWRTVGIIRKVGKRRPVFQLRDAGEGAGTWGNEYSEEAARRAMLTAHNVTEVVE